MAAHALRVWQANTHRGRVIGAAFKKQVDTLKPDVIVLCEITAASTWAEIHRLFSDDFHIFPGPAHTKGKWAYQTPVLFRKSRFFYISQDNPLVSKWLGGGKFGQLWPTRYTTRARMLDRLTNRTTIVHSVHTWYPAAQSIKGHRQQIQAVANSVKVRAADRVVIAAGDYNENLNSATSEAYGILNKVGMHDAHRILGLKSEATSIGHTSRLDGCFYRAGSFIRPAHQQTISIAGSGADHRGVLTDFSIDSAPAPRKAKRVTFHAPNPPYVGPAAHTTAGHNKPIHRIVLHSTVSPCCKGAARETAAYFRKKSAGGSAHYVVDPFETVQVVFDDTIAWHAPPNKNSIGIEMTEMPSAVNLVRWFGYKRNLMWHRAARLTAELCLAYDVPPYYVDAKGLKAGHHGVTTHRQVSLAFHQSTHWDPGAWPRYRFMREVRKQVEAIKAGK